MGVGARQTIRDGSLPDEARVQNKRLWVDAAVAAIAAPIDLTVEVTEDDPVPATPQLLPIAAEVDFAVGFLPVADGDWSHLRVNAFGQLWIDLLASGQTGDTPGANPFAVMVAGENSSSEQEHLKLDDSNNLKTVNQANVSESDAAFSNPFLLPGGATRDDSIAAALLEPPGDWVRLRVDGFGAQWTRSQATQTEGLAAGISSGSEWGVTSLFVRDDDLTQKPAHVADGDLILPRTDERGATWVRMASMSGELSGSTDGQPIQITTVATLGDTIHTAVATAGFSDKVYLFVTNTGTTEETITFEFGGTGAGNNIVLPVPCGDTILAIPGFAIGNSGVITAFASTANVLNVAGYFERHVNP